MNIKTRIFNDKNNLRGGMLFELLMCVALAAIIIPFVARYQQNAIRRAQNIAIVRQMQTVQSALEKYINVNRAQLLATVGRNITRVEIGALVEYGLPDAIAVDASHDYQLRVIKSMDWNGRASLQGVVVLAGGDITPLRTREIINIGGDQTGFIEDNHAYGAFGAWRTDAVDLGVNARDAIVETTAVTRGDAKYLWRVPSDSASDATMGSVLNLGGHNINDVAFFDVRAARFDDKMNTTALATDKMVFQNRTTIDKEFRTATATVAGTLSADSRNMDVAGTLKLADVAKFNGFTTGDLYVTNLTLPGLSIIDDGTAATLNISKSLDMTVGRVDAMFVTVGFAGSVTPRLVVGDRIEDSTNSAYYWDAVSGAAHFSDVNMADLSRMAPMVVKLDAANQTESGRAFRSAAINKNATAADFMNAIEQMQSAVRAKYRLLNLE